MFVIHLFVVVAPKCSPLLTSGYSRNLTLNLNLQASFENEEE